MRFYKPCISAASEREFDNANGIVAKQSSKQIGQPFGLRNARYLERRTRMRPKLRPKPLRSLIAPSRSRDSHIFYSATDLKHENRLIIFWTLFLLRFSGGGGGGEGWGLIKMLHRFIFSLFCHRDSSRRMCVIRYMSLTACKFWLLTSDRPSCICGWLCCLELCFSSL